MHDYEVGYGRPPKKSRFRPGVSGNPKGRRKRKPSTLAEIIHGVLSGPIEYRERGRTMAATHHELSLKLLIDHAIKGNLGAAELVLRARTHAERYGDAGIDRLQISDWLPDYPGQTADQKTQKFATTGAADPLEWWSKPATKPDAA
jgi:hypothetical protein